MKNRPPCWSSCGPQGSCLRKQSVLVQELQDGQLSHIGEIKNLRRQLEVKEAAFKGQQQEKKQEMAQVEEQQRDTVTKLEKDIEKLKSEILFKENDLQNANERCNRMESQIKQSTTVTSSIGSPQKVIAVPSHTHSPKPSRSRSPRTPRRTGFPTKQTFLSEETSPHCQKTAGRSRTLSESEGTKTEKMGKYDINNS